jgi:8-oxo-dGTP diphosphatase
MNTYVVVSGVIKNQQGRVLLLKKSLDDKVYPNKWSFCAGHVKEFEALEETMKREIEEETKLDARIHLPGKIIEIEDSSKGKRWIVACFLCETNTENVTLCHENSSFAWVTPKEALTYDLVPGAEKDLKVLGLL